MTKEELLLQKRLLELSETAYQRDIAVFSDFLNLNELNILHSTPKNMFSSRYETYGGYEFAERQMAAFLPDALYYDYKYPLTVLQTTPLAKKFAENLTHRDYLGAVLNLGIERSKIGDILVKDEECFLFVSQTIATYICDNLTRIRHTEVTTEESQTSDVEYSPRFTEVSGTVASVRLDSVLSLGFGLSRSKCTGLAESGRVFVNGKLITTNAYHLKEKDIISVRGMGRICYQGMLSQTKKGRYSIAIHRYI